MRVRYDRWSGRQDPFPAEVSADTVLDELSDDLLAGLSPDEALARLLGRGLSSRNERVAGLADLRRRVLQARQRELGRMGLDGPLRRVEQQLSEIVDLERAALQFDDSAQAPDKQAQLDGLPRDVAGRIAALSDYEFTDAQAAADFRALMDQLLRDVAEATFGRLAGALGSMSPEDLARMREMLAELNQMIAQRDRGEPVDFDAFRERYGDLLPGDPQTLDELLEDLARRMAALSSLMAGLDARQRAELAALAEQALGDLDLSFQADQLRMSLESLFPGLGWGEPAEAPGAVPGQQAGSLAQTVDWVEHLQSYDDLAEALGQDYPGASLEDVDAQALRRALGDEAVRDLAALREIERVLEEAGAAHRTRGRLELTPRGIRKLGEASLTRIYDRVVSGVAGSHDARRAGGEGELTGATRPLEFGDPFRLDVARTVFNSIVRVAAERTPGSAATLYPQDFELAEAEQRVRAATVLALDMSFSMPLRGNWVPAKRVALALHSLIAGKFPEDAFYIIGFSDYARRLAPRDLLATGWERVYGTNMQHAFLLARRLLAAHPAAHKQVIMVTDGEPTAHLEGDVPFFAWPPEPTTLRLTMTEAARLARTGTTLNVFLLDHDPGAAAFMERMVAAYGGRIFYPDLGDLGRLVVRDFLAGRGG